MLGAIACVTGRADFLVSLLSQATSNINPAQRTKMLKRFTGLLPVNTRFPSSYLFCWTSPAAERQHAKPWTLPGPTLTCTDCGMNTKKKAPENRRGLWLLKGNRVQLG